AAEDARRQRAQIVSAIEGNSRQPLTFNHRRKSLMAVRLRTVLLLLFAIITVPGVSFGESASFVVNTNSRASFKTEAPLETIIGTVATPSGTPVESRNVTGTIA